MVSGLGKEARSTAATAVGAEAERARDAIEQAARMRFAHVAPSA